jgi:hypothetical protein
MARFRIETVVDPATNLIFTELYYPDSAATPMAKTAPIYSSHEEADDRADPNRHLRPIESAT